MLDLVNFSPDPEGKSLFLSNVRVVPMLFADQT